MRPKINHLSCGFSNQSFVPKRDRIFTSPLLPILEFFSKSFPWMSPLRLGECRRRLRVQERSLRGGEERAARLPLLGGLPGQRRLLHQLQDPVQRFGKSTRPHFTVLRARWRKSHIRMCNRIINGRQKKKCLKASSSFFFLPLLLTTQLADIALAAACPRLLFFIAFYCWTFRRAVLAAGWLWRDQDGWMSCWVGPLPQWRSRGI